MQSLIRERFWIIRARKTIKSILNECFICARFKVKSLSSGPSPLPPDRVNDCAIFEVVGIDLAGPLSLSLSVFKNWRKALRRFIARRGRPSIIYCDNGTNFRSAFNDLAKLDWHKISRETSTQKIVWKFIPPTAAWWGGWWERLVRIIKELLRRSLGKSILSYEELSTVICDCEFLINSRPLTYISENPQELIPLTPAMFLIENRCSDTTDIDELNSRDLRKRMKYRIKLLSDLRQRFRKEYLSELIQKQNDNRVREPRIGEMVLIGNDNKKRLSWPIAKIIELIPGRDGEIRTVRLKTQHGTVIRPVQRIFPLEVQAIANSDKELKEESISVKSTKPEKVLNTNDAIVKKYTSSGRLVKEPNRPRLPVGLTPVQIFGQPVPWVRVAKYLGLFLDAKLTFAHHIEQTRKKAQAVHAVLKRLISRRSKLAIRHKVLLCKSIIRPVMSYGSQIWGSTGMCHLKKLHTLTNSFLRQIVNAPWFVRNEVIYRDLKIKSFLPHIKNLSKRFFDKLPSVPNELIRNQPAYDSAVPSSQKRPRALLEHDFINFPQAKRLRV
ncbi:RNA-directed DNA polymerase from mobile element jockey [Trichonephila clavipes]|nr:RNA-directed DNA polymerase from mobile element jockey [Trichonephila clavipes]